MLRYAGTLVFFAVAIAGAYFLSAGTEPPFAEAGTIADGARDFEELQERFEDLAEGKGGVYAFEILRRAELPSNTDLHLLGHAVGDVLYAQKGVEGIADCTQDFRNACSHSIVIGALNDFGESALDMIRDACKKAPGGSGAYTMCYHGLGHGVFAYFSYDLAQTVDFCRKTGTSEYHDREYIECVGGAVMELMGGGGHDRGAWLLARETYLDPSRPLSPCMDSVIPDEAKEQCFIYLTPRLWEVAGVNLGHPNPDLFPQSFALCDAIPLTQQKLRYACFGGFGKEFVVLAGERDVRDVASFTDAQFARAIEWCEFAGVEDGKRACIAEAIASVFWGGENDPEASFRFCGLVQERAMQDACYEKLAEAIRQYTKGEHQTALCARLPEEYGRTCAGEV